MYGRRKVTRSKGATLEQALKEDHDARQEPFVVSKFLRVPLLDAQRSRWGTVGTTSSGAVNDLQEIGPECASYLVP